MLESTLIDQTISQFPSFLNLGKNFISSREIPAGRRFIDILYVDLNEDFDENLDALSKIASLNSKQLLLLSFFIDGKRKTKHFISTNFNVKWESVNTDYLSVFKKKNLINQIGTKTFQATDWLGIIPNKLISIEAKIEDWQTVIQQAKYNTEYTSESYILFPDNYFKKISGNREKLCNANIGVFTADKLFNINFAHKPKTKHQKGKSLITDYMKLSILKSYYTNPSKWER